MKRLRQVEKKLEKKVGKKLKGEEKVGKKFKGEKKGERRKIEHKIGMALTGLRGVLIQRTRFWRRFNQFMIGSSLKYDFGFCNRTRNPKTDFTSDKSVLGVDFN